LPRAGRLLAPRLHLLTPPRRAPASLSLVLPLSPNLQIGECVGTWWRPNFDTVLYPYLPPHITRPKELKRLFIVPLLERSCFAVRALWRGTPARPSLGAALSAALLGLCGGAARTGGLHDQCPPLRTRPPSSTPPPSRCPKTSGSSRSPRLSSTTAAPTST
jgi:hypothetical protein